MPPPRDKLFRALVTLARVAAALLVLATSWFAWLVYSILTTQ